MAQSKDLLAMRASERMSSHADPFSKVVPGSWWRLTGKCSGLEDREAPDHGLILLVNEVRIIDGEIHTVVLRDHPRWGERGIKILLEEFMTNFTFDPQGEALREKELQDLMEEINGITKMLASPPSDSALMEALPAPETSTPEVDARVPAALLPSGDVNQAQARIESAIAVMEARRDWVAGHTKDMQSRMALVGAFQKEKVDVALAGISEQRKAAENLLSGVQTMRLFLGEDQDFRTLVEGEGARSDAPLHFMQRMLYLDEELFTHSRLDGLNGDDFEDLPRILSENPDLVARMLPHERSVAIAKMRRKTRELDFEISLENIFQVMDIVDQDRCIQILIRNGDQVHMVTTDEITSKATRLFPSRREIDNIFTERDYRGGGYRTITPQDVEYSDKRSDHDARALFYKRVLLILWGLSEREGILGDFIESGANWLEETVHNKSFVFIHDEEDVLPDGRYPSITKFLEMNRRSVQPGSRVLVQWSNAISEDTAPQMYEARSSRSDFAYMRNQPVEDFSVVVAQRKDANVVALCPVTRQTWRSDQNRQFNSPVKLKTTVQSWGKYKDQTAAGFICLDTLRAEDLRYYFESRIHRENYLEYLHLFDRALKILASEEAQSAMMRDEILTRVDTGPEVVSQAMHIWRTANKGEIPVTEKELAKVVDLCSFLSVGLPEISGDILYIDATAKRTLEIARRHDMEVFGITVPIAEIDVMAYGPRTGWRVKSSQFGPITSVAAPGAYRLQGSAPEAVISAFETIHPALRDPAALEVLRTAPVKGDGMEALLAVKSFLRGEQGFDLDHMLDTASEYYINHLRNREGRVVVPVIRHTLGYAMDTHGTSQDLFRISVTIQPDILALQNGAVDELWDFLDGLYENPDRRLAFLKERLESGKSTAALITVQKLDENHSISKDPSLKGVTLEAEADYSFSLNVLKEDDGFYKKDVLFSENDIRELLVRRIANRGFYRAPETLDKMIPYVDGIRLEIFEGCGELIEEVAGVSISDVPAIDCLKDADNGCDDAPSP